MSALPTEWVDGTSFRARLLLLTLLAFATWVGAGLRSRPEPTRAVEVGSHDAWILPRGKEADGILGDFVLRNDRIEALVAGNLPGRRANMMHDRDEVIPGTLFDLDLRAASNDQITSFRPGHLSGRVSYVRIAEEIGDGSAAVETVRTATLGGGVYEKHLYRLGPGWQHLEITSTFRNEAGEPRVVRPEPVWKHPPEAERLLQFSRVWEADRIRVGDSIDPFDKRAYAWVPIEAPGNSSLKPEITLQPGDERRFEIALAVAGSPAQAYGVAAALIGPVGTFEGKIVDSGGEPASRATLILAIGEQEIPLYPDREGSFSCLLPPGTYRARLHDLGRTEEELGFRISRDRATRLEITPAPASRVRFRISDGAGDPSPAKVQFLGLDGTPTPDLGTDYRAHGCDHQYQSHDGRFTQQIPPGDYLLRITRGPEFDLVEQTLSVPPGRLVEVEATLHRTVDTSGWISTDYHSHSTPSGDNHCSTRDRMINFAAEHLEFVPTTEHNRIYDWEPYIGELGLEKHLRTVVGIELTGRGQHFNAFPLEYTPLAQDGGGPEWQYDPRLNAIVLRNAFGGGPHRWVQANHPIVGHVFNDRDEDGRADRGFQGLEKLIDAAEVWSAEILNLEPTYPYTSDEGTFLIENRTFGWLQLLNQGRHVWCVAVSDAHRIFGEWAVGSWRTYVPSSTDEPAKIDPAEIIRNSKAGRMMISNGPFLEVETAGRLPIGSRIVSPGSVTLRIRVQTPNWFEVDRVQILVNGQQPPEYNFTRSSHPDRFRARVLQFEEEVTVELEQDSHLIVVAIGEGSNLRKGWGRSPVPIMPPVAFTNPIYVDVDGNGFQASGDTLGHPLLVAPEEPEP